jgi:GDP-D-mannose dehydratase
MKDRIDAIIFGSNGQDGKYLKFLLEKEGKKVDCISRSGANVIGDIRDYPFVEDQIKQKRPKYIFNFAAISTAKHSALFENHQTICTGTLNILNRQDFIVLTPKYLFLEALYSLRMMGIQSMNKQHLKDLVHIPYHEFIQFMLLDIFGTRLVCKHM